MEKAYKFRIYPTDAQQSLIRKIFAVETLYIKGMMQTRWLAKSIGDAAWGEFVRQLGYKSSWYGKQFVLVGKEYPSSQLCSNCGHHEPKLKGLRIREWDCPRMRQTPRQGHKRSRQHPQRRVEDAGGIRPNFLVCTAGHVGV
jgi:putative transposase